MENRKPRKFVIMDDSTIYESRDQQADNELGAKRPNKRQRVDSDDEDETGGGTTHRDGSFTKDPAATASWTRDPEFFAGDQQPDEHVLRFGNVLFKVSDAALDRCPHLKKLVYNGRTSIPQSERYDEKTPLHLTVPDTEEGLRAVLWAIHTSEADLATVPRDRDDFDRVLDLTPACITFKLNRLLEWCLQILDTAVHHESNFLESCSSAQLTKLLTVTRKCNREDLLTAVSHKWCSRLRDKSVPAVPALHAAEEFGLADLKGEAYYTALMDMVGWQTISPGAGATQLRADPKLKPGQIMRLLSGYWSLVHFWERFRRTPIALPIGGECTKATHDACSAVWTRRWSASLGWSRILHIQSSDVRELLHCFRDQLSNDDELKTGLKPSCRLAGLAALKSTAEDFDKHLASHFGGVV